MSLERFILHFFTNLIIPAILVSNEFSIFNFDELLDKLGNCATFGILDEVSDKFAASCDSTQHTILRCATSPLRFAGLFIVVLLDFANDIGFVCLYDAL